MMSSSAPSKQSLCMTIIPIINLQTRPGAPPGPNRQGPAPHPPSQGHSLPDTLIGTKHRHPGDNRCVNAMGASSSRSVLFGKKKKHKPAVFRALSVLRGALHIKTLKKKKKNNNSLLTLHGWGPKKQKREGPLKSWLSLDGKGKKKSNKSFGNSSPKDSVFKHLPTRRKGGNDEGSGKEEKETKGGLLSNKGPPRPFVL
ncbi:unnamed protein product [Arctogadus glacialis]